MAVFFNCVQGRINLDFNNTKSMLRFIHRDPAAIILVSCGQEF